jgi:hypothetical protein
MRLTWRRWVRNLKGCSQWRNVVEGCGGGRQAKGKRGNAEQCLVMRCVSPHHDYQFKAGDCAGAMWMPSYLGLGSRLANTPTIPRSLMITVALNFGHIVQALLFLDKHMLICASQSDSSDERGHRYFAGLRLLAPTAVFSRRKCDTETRNPKYRPEHKK